MSKILNDAMLAFTKHMPCRKIIKDGDLYLCRYFVGFCGDGYQEWLHHILLADSDERMHTHPWQAKCEVLNGGYAEFFLDECGARQVRYRSPSASVREFVIEKNTTHRIFNVLPNTWTHLIVSPGRTDWGFLNPDGTMERMESNGEDWWKNEQTRDSAYRNH